MKFRASPVRGQTASLRRRQRGVAMVIAMLVFALSAALVVAMSSEFALLMKKGSNVFIGQQAAAYLRGGEDLAGLVLRQDREQDREADSLRDDLQEVWAQQVPPYALDEGGWLAGRLVDLQGRFNLNDLDGRAPEGKRFTPAQEQFIRLLQTPEEPGISEQDAVLITESILDWLDRDGDPRDFGAEDDYYFDQSPSYRSANREFSSVSELRVVAYMTPELYAAVAPYLTVWGSGGKINIHTADIALLRSINSPGDLQPLTLAEGEALFQLREDEGFSDVQGLLDSQVLGGREIDATVTARLGESSSWFLYLGEVEVADRVARLYSVLHRDGTKVEAVVRSNAPI